MQSYKILGILALTTTSVYAQKEIDLGSQQYDVVKDRKIEMPEANRVFEKIQPIPSKAEDRQVKYTFFDRKPTGIEEVKFNPNIVQPEFNKNKKDEYLFNNYAKVGAGNFGRWYGEAFLHTSPENPLSFGINGLHNSTTRGPVDNKNSGVSKDLINLEGKYHTNAFEINANAGYERRAYAFYGYKRMSNVEVPKDSIRQTINIFKADFALRNIIPNPRVDYSLKTSIHSLSDYYSATELDWGTNFKAYFPVIEQKFIALINADAYMTQRSDSIINKRNLFRVEPSFKLNLNSFGAKIGYRAVNEFDEIAKVNRTKGFPTAEITYKTPSLLYFYAGFEGDIVRNTLSSFLNENPFLQKKITLLNTEKNQDFYIGSRGDLVAGVSYNVKASYGKYKNLYFFNNDFKTDSTKFIALYDTTKTRFINVSAQFNYQPVSFWRTNLKVDYFNYGVKMYAKAFHRPSMNIKWGNTLIFSDKMIVNLETYFISSSYAQNTEKNTLIKNKSIVDLNAEFDYLMGKQFTVFVKLNNIIGKNYQRYLYYPQQGLNFLVGVNFSF